MGIFKKQKQATGRSRHASKSEERPAPSLAYYSRRSDEDYNTGRKQSVPKRQVSLRDVFRFWMQRLGLLVLLIVVIVCAVNVLLLSNDAKIVSVDKADHSYSLHAQQDYQEAANRILSQSIWNQNKITVDTAKLSRELKRQFPELSEVTVTLPLLGHRPTVHVQVAQPAVVLATDRVAYVLDSNGRALLENRNANAFKGLNLPVVTDQSGIQPTIGKVALAHTSVSFIQEVVGQLKEKNISVETMTLPAASNQLDVKIARQPYYVKFNLQSQTPKEQVGTYLATKSWLANKKITPRTYIDVRVEGRAYYK